MAYAQSSLCLRGEHEDRNQDCGIIDLGLDN